jgi:hypothetical protein
MAEHTTPPDALVTLWASARATQQASAAIAARDGADTDLRFTTAAAHCGEAADELQRLRPDIAGAADIPALADELDGVPTAQASDRLVAAIAAATTDFDLDDPRLLPTDVLAAGTAANWLAMAHHAISGRLP